MKSVVSISLKKAFHSRFYDLYFLRKHKEQIVQSNLDRDGIFDPKKIKFFISCKVEDWLSFEHKAVVHC